MVSEDTREEKSEKQNENGAVKKLIYRNPDQFGYATNLVFILAATCVIALSVFILILFSMN